MAESKMLEVDEEPVNGNKAGASRPTTPKVHWNDSNMKTSYANVVNVVSSREEFTVFFGTNQTWNVRADTELVVDLSNRIILNPHATKRLLTLLAAVLGEYEKRHGKVNIDPRASQPL
jgi:hypothetical protein